jgi:ribosomal protein L24
LEKEVLLTDLSWKNIVATEQELNLFRRSGDELVIEALRDVIQVVPSSLHISDRVQATTGTFKGMTGLVVDIHDHNTVVFECEANFDHHDHQSGKAQVTSPLNVPARSRFTVLSSEVRKKFELQVGDHVQVVYGEHRIHCRDEC